MKPEVRRLVLSLAVALTIAVAVAVAFPMRNPCANPPAEGWDWYHLFLGCGSWFDFL